MTTSHVTLTVCTLNDPQDLEALLRTIPNDGSGPNQIVVVEAGDLGACKDAVRRSDCGVPALVVAQDPERPGLSSARNQAIDRTEPGWVVIADADFRFQDSSIWAALRELDATLCIARCDLQGATCLGNAYRLEFPATRPLAFRRVGDELDPRYAEGLGSGEDALFWSQFGCKWPEPEANITESIQRGVPSNVSAIMRQQAWYIRTTARYQRLLNRRGRVWHSARLFLDSVRIAAPLCWLVLFAAYALIFKSWQGGMLAPVPMILVSCAKLVRGKRRFGKWHNPACAFLAEQARLWGRIQGLFGARR